MSQTSLMLTPTMEGWQDRELDAKTSYLMDNVKYTSRGTFCPFFLLHYYIISLSGLGVFWLLFLPALGIYYTIRTRHTVRHSFIEKAATMMPLMSVGDDNKWCQLWWWYTFLQVRKLVLRKGGKMLSMQTYGVIHTYIWIKLTDATIK